MIRPIKRLFSRMRATVTAVLTAMPLILACGCGGGAEIPSASSSDGGDSTPIYPNWPPEAEEFRFHWSASPGIDLETGSAVAVRAYLESYRLIGLAGGDLSAAYPGFLRATPENVQAQDPGDLFQLGHLRPDTRPERETGEHVDIERRYYGYQPTHILSLLPEGDGYRATVCVGAYSVYRFAHHRFSSIMSDPQTGELLYGDRQNVEIWRVELTDNGPVASEAAPSPSAPQRGPLPGPAEDVFGRWHFTGTSSGLWGPNDNPEDVDPPEIRKQCEDAMPDDASARAAMAGGFHDTPPPHGDPIPGWPVLGR